jgi:hypothetical protein
MAESPAHKFGQIIGDVLEAAVEPLLGSFAEEHDLYLDKKGPRPARRGNKVSWTDNNGNTHDLDYVIERGGSGAKIGKPVAFIETAWRRYTKHSRNKAQEIQGALVPLLETYKNDAPLIGAILAGVFTDGALTQLRSLGFAVVYFPYESVIEAFNRAHLDANFDEGTADAEFSRKIRAWEGLGRAQRMRVAKALLEINGDQIQGFMDKLKRAVTRRIQSVRIIPLHGSAVQCSSIEEAIAFVEKYSEQSLPQPVVKYEVQVLYTNGDRIEGQFGDKRDAIQFLGAYREERIAEVRKPR